MLGARPQCFFPLIYGVRHFCLDLGLALLDWLVFLIMSFPVYWMVLTSFRRGSDIQKPTPQFLPQPATLNNYRKVAAAFASWSKSSRHGPSLPLRTRWKKAKYVLMKNRGRILLIQNTLLMSHLPAETQWSNTG